MSKGGPQKSAVDRAADLFTSIAAQGETMPLWQVFGFLDELGLTHEQALDALAFLEAAGLVNFVTVIEVTRPVAPVDLREAAE